MDYFKTHGRQPVEIETWLKTQYWYSSFRQRIQEEILNSTRDENDAIYLTSEIETEIDNKLKEVTEGYLDKNTISQAFCWADTSEGTKYWGNKEYQFLKWYYGQYIDFHL